jgi:hypothetical protein
MSKKIKYHVRKRKFLNRYTDMPAFIIAIVENTRDMPDAEDKKRGEIELTLADCSDRISFYFNLNTAHQRANSLRKIKLLSETINDFRKALETEAEAISKCKSSINKPKTKSQTAG